MKKRVKHHVRGMFDRVRDLARFLADEQTVFRFRYFGKRWITRLGRRRKIRVLFYPDLPHPKTAIYKICYLNGYDMINDPTQNSRLAIHWADETRRKSDDALESIAKKKHVINIECRDISKKHVDAVFRDVFGYSVMIDPHTHRGPCVVKSDGNALHDGKIILCPVREVREDCVYQKVINNAVCDATVQDIRAPVFGKRIPFLYLKDRPAEERVRFRKFHKATMVPVEAVISGEEVKKVLEFADKFGVDYGELDILRDNDDGRLYIIDVNNTPYGPPKHLPPEDYRQALDSMKRNFEEVFLGDPLPGTGGNKDGAW